jgi:predicted butyrate kinase (DUF1464 family)
MVGTGTNGWLCILSPSSCVAFIAVSGRLTDSCNVCEDVRESLKNNVGKSAIGEVCGRKR